MSWRDTYREYVNLPRNQLISMAINAADGIMCVISAAEGSHRTAKRMLAMLFGGIAVDNGDVAYAEYELYKEVMSTLEDEYVSYDEFYDICCSSRSMRINEIKRYYDMDYIRNDVVTLALCIAAIDDRIDSVEQELIEYFDQY